MIWRFIKFATKVFLTIMIIALILDILGHM
jgi:hypothetical protein